MGKKAFSLKEKYIGFQIFTEIQILTFDHKELKTEKDLWKACEMKDLITSGFMGIEKWIPINILEQVGENVTTEFIQDDFGYLKELKIDTSTFENYVDPKEIYRIKEY